MAMAVHFMVSIRLRAIPYLSCIDKVESPCQYSMVITTAVEGPGPPPHSANQTKSRDMWRVACGGRQLEVDEYDIYYILKINMSSSYV